VLQIACLFSWWWRGSCSDGRSRPNQRRCSGYIEGNSSSWPSGPSTSVMSPGGTFLALRLLCSISPLSTAVRAGPWLLSFTRGITTYHTWFSFRRTGQKTPHHARTTWVTLITSWRPSGMFVRFAGTEPCGYQGVALDLAWLKPGQSRGAGCTWSRRAQVPGYGWRYRPGPGG